MASDLNKYACTGRLTRDAELYETASGTAIVNFSIAVNDRVKGKDGEYRDKPVFFTCKFFGNDAKALQPKMLKGTPVSIIGRIVEDKWTGRDGAERTEKTITVEDIVIHQKQPSKAATEPQEAYYPPSSETYAEDIPF